jgi:hypothetical protein
MRAHDRGQPERRSPPIRGHSAAARKSPQTRDCVVVDAARIEPVSTSNSLVTGKRTGNFAETDLPRRFSRPIGPRIQWLTIKFPTQWSREFFGVNREFSTKNREFHTEWRNAGFCIFELHKGAHDHALATHATLCSSPIDWAARWPRSGLTPKGGIHPRANITLRPRPRLYRPGAQEHESSSAPKDADGVGA